MAKTVQSYHSTALPTLAAMRVRIGSLCGAFAPSWSVDARGALAACNSSWLVRSVSPREGSPADSTKVTANVADHIKVHIIGTFFGFIA